MDVDKCGDLHFDGNIQRLACRAISAPAEPPVRMIISWMAAHVSYASQNVSIAVALQLIDATRSHLDIVGDMSRVTLNFNLSKIRFVFF